MWQSINPGVIHGAADVDHLHPRQWAAAEIGGQFAHGHDRGDVSCADTERIAPTVRARYRVRAARMVASRALTQIRSQDKIEPAGMGSWD